MPRISWFDDTTNLQVIDEQVDKLESFAAAMADGVIEAQELAKQQETLTSVMREVEGALSDDQHEQVTRLLVELSAYNIMRVLHELAAQRLQRALSRDV